MRPSIQAHLLSDFISILGGLCLLFSHHGDLWASKIWPVSYDQSNRIQIVKMMALWYHWKRPIRCNHSNIDCLLLHSVAFIDLPCVAGFSFRNDLSCVWTFAFSELFTKDVNRQLIILLLPLPDTNIISFVFFTTKYQGMSSIGIPCSAFLLPRLGKEAWNGYRL